MLYFVIAFFLALIPFIFYPGVGDGIRTPKEIASIIGFITIIGICISNYSLKPFKNKWLLFFLGWCFLITTFNSGYIPIYLNKAVIEMPSYLFAWKELFYITLSIVTIYCLSSVKTLSENKDIHFSHLTIQLREHPISYHILKLSNLINWVVIGICTYAIIQALGFDQIFRVGDYGTGWMAHTNTEGAFSHRIVATIGNPDILALWISLLLPFIFYSRTRISFISLVMAIIVLVITQCTTSIGVAIAVTMFYLFFKSKKAFFISLILLLSISSVFYYYKSDKVKTYLNPTGRFEVHKEAYKMIRDKNAYLTGFGLGSFEQLIGLNPEVVKRLNNNNWREAHDEYLQGWFSVGLVGLSIFLMFIFTSFVRFLRNITNESIVLAASLFGVLLMSFLQFPLRVPPLAFYIVIITGLFLNVIQTERNL